MRRGLLLLVLGLSLVLPAAALATSAPRLPSVLREADLQPYFSGELAHARRLLDSDPAKALELLKDAGDAPPVRYLRALALSRAGEPALAAPRLRALAAAMPALSDRIHLEAGRAAAQAQAHASAVRSYAKVPSGSLVYPEARLGMATALQAQGKLREAIQALAPVAKRAEPASGKDWAAAALSMQASLAARLADPKAERRALLELWEAHPRSPLAEEAAGRLADIPLASRVARAERLTEAHHNQPAIAELEPLFARLKLPDDLACRAGFALGDALRKERRHLRALQVLAPVVDKCPAMLPRALYSMASSQSIAHPTSGPGLYDRLAREFPKFHLVDQVHWFASALELQAGEHGAARERLEMLAARYPGGEHAPEALFKLFWLDYRAARHEAALKRLDEILERYAGRGYERQRAQYWRARLLGELERTEESLQGLVRLASDDPASYYGVAALRRLDELDPARAARARRLEVSAESKGPWPLSTGTLAADPHAIAAVELLRLGFSEEAAAELAAAAGGRPRGGSARLVAFLLGRAGDHKGAHMLARVHLHAELTGRPTPRTRATWELAYPRAWRPEVEKHCAAAGVEPDFLQALMREESALDPKARSWAGAIGLTQLLPERGEQVARAIGLEGFEGEQLLDPETSIRLGCAHLGALLKEFDGELVFAYGAYNAEPRRIHRWIERAPGKPIDVFVEEIPIAETRGYVKRLLRTLATYRLLYGR